MSLFAPRADPSPELIREAAVLAPCNPFITVEYAAARRALGDEPWLLALRQAGRPVSACLAFVSNGRLTRSVEIASWPGRVEPDLFFEGLLQWCRKHSVSRLELNTFSSEAPCLPPHGRSLRRTRTEFVLDLLGSDLLQGISSNHVRNIKRAQKAGVTLRRTTDLAASREHARLMGASLARRKERGEEVEGSSTQVQTQGPSETPLNDSLEAPLSGPVPAFVAHRAGELFQALTGDRLLSSILVLRAAKGGYYHSAGTTPEGMACGASHWLVHHIARALQSEGAERFNLGGAHEDGLVRFKVGFGTSRRELEAAEIHLTRPVMRWLTAGGRSLDRLVGTVRDLRLMWGGVRSQGTR